jgi:hypothetical protein
MHVVAAAVGPRGRPRVIGLLSVMNPDTWKPLSENLDLLGEWPRPLERCVTSDEVAVRAAHYAYQDVLDERDGAPNSAPEPSALA